jgi:hypothetical protein
MVATKPTLSIERVKEIVSDEDLTDEQARALRDATYALVRSLLDKWLKKVLTKGESSGRKRGKYPKDYESSTKTTK